ncbi:ABC transporter substrate-binding protein [Sinomonas cellulolyticus]|jgi:polar amino acid transport system substrate-binding protein|uniref:ABC transporter substrate-binding protein n=1 Tax=Sinomonas cellulolyticus TaxID=2801916 RepID=A0ABS1JXJ0_9MICC|nr:MULTISPECIES: ABC transporter substrate-binding protein [Sinomonas]MBL0704101.1 ABC transporter substrate-binding protein [Sinomonas cellulolyticus]GHG57065.1 ABC transporter substrate-binding protein [Sinomonas sp. KCTC 49339]
MTFSAKLAAKGAAVLAVGALALTACTNASETGGGAKPSGSSSSTASFDPSTVAKDDSLASQVPAAIKSKGTLVVGSDTSYAPAEFLGGADNHTPMGYDVDIAKAIGQTLGLKTDVQTADFTGILPALGPKYDLGISSFTINKERLQAVNFVSYFNAGTAWAVQKGNPKKFSLDDVCGKTIGVQTGTVQEDPDLKDRNDKCVKDGKKPIEIVSLKAQTDLNTRLVNGSLDAMAADSPIIGYAIQQTNGAVEKIGDTYDAAPQGIAVAKSDTAFADLIQKVMTKLMADGTYKKILDTWNNSEGAITKSEVNPTPSS